MKKIITSVWFTVSYAVIAFCVFMYTAYDAGYQQGEHDGATWAGREAYTAWVDYMEKHHLWDSVWCVDARESIDHYLPLEP